ncbi:MAG: hypothetical protein M3R01_00150 [Actinomycetota bacterium]|nr:hypothetical protein [Actinomycetota bacterium]
MRWALVCVTVAAVAGVACQGGNTFTVDSTGDGADARGDGVCATSSGTCTLRAAIAEANNRDGHDVIAFDISGSGVQLIRPATRLPSLTDPAGATIDGYTQDSAAVNTSATASNARLTIELRGQGYQSFDGLVLTSPGNVVRGLSVWDFRIQVLLAGNSADGNQVLGSFLGTNPAGTVGASGFGSFSHGVHVDNGASGNRIGRPGNANRNVVSGNWQNGVSLYNLGTRANIIQNNIVGLRPDGLGALPNRSHGVDINAGASDNLVGGTGGGERNVVAGNGQTGVEISHDPTTLGNDVIGNFIGTGVDGARAVRNGQYGVFLEGLAQCNATCTPDAGESTVSNNIIVNNNGGVAIMKGRHDDVLTNNHIGVLPNGTPAPNTVYGVRVEKGSMNTTVGPGNVIARNGSGVQIQAQGSNPGCEPPGETRGCDEAPTNGNTVTANRIFLNTGFGIDLARFGEVTADPGAKVNASIDIPVLSLSNGRVRARTCVGCTVELFVADTTSTTQYGEGRDLLATEQADATGLALFDTNVGQGRVVTATATDAAGNTSEFSQNLAGPP